eukprot:Clim_evm32s247 gene=Clim_evmTU32s247
MLRKGAISLFTGEDEFTELTHRVRQPSSGGQNITSPYGSYHSSNSGSGASRLGVPATEDTTDMQTTERQDKQRLSALRDICDHLITRRLTDLESMKIWQEIEDLANSSVLARQTLLLFVMNSLQAIPGGPTMAGLSLRCEYFDFIASEKDPATFESRIKALSILLNGGKNLQGLEDKVPGLLCAWLDSLKVEEDSSPEQGTEYIEASGVDRAGLLARNVRGHYRDGLDEYSTGDMGLDGTHDVLRTPRSGMDERSQSEMSGYNSAIGGTQVRTDRQQIGRSIELSFSVARILKVVLDAIPGHFTSRQIVCICEHVNTLALNAQDAEELGICLDILDVIINNAVLPGRSHVPFVRSMCFAVNVEQYCIRCWAIMRHFLISIAGFNGLKVMCGFLDDPSMAESPHLIRGAIFYLGMASWGGQSIKDLRYSQLSILSSMCHALSFDQSIVANEIVLSMQRLVTKFAADFDSLRWDVLYNILDELSRYADYDIAMLTTSTTQMTVGPTQSQEPSQVVISGGSAESSRRDIQSNHEAADHSQQGVAQVYDHDMGTLGVVDEARIASGESSNTRVGAQQQEGTLGANRKIGSGEQASDTGDFLARFVSLLTLVMPHLQAETFGGPRRRMRELVSKYALQLPPKEALDTQKFFLEDVSNGMPDALDLTLRNLRRGFYDDPRPEVRLGTIQTMHEIVKEHKVMIGEARIVAVVCSVAEENCCDPDSQIRREMVSLILSLAREVREVAYYFDLLHVLQFFLYTEVDDLEDNLTPEESSSFAATLGLCGVFINGIDQAPGERALGSILMLCDHLQNHYDSEFAGNLAMSIRLEIFRFFSMFRTNGFGQLELWLTPADIERYGLVPTERSPSTPDKKGVNDDTGGMDATGNSTQEVETNRQVPPPSVLSDVPAPPNVIKFTSSTVTAYGWADDEGIETEETKAEVETSSPDLETDYAPKSLPMRRIFELFATALTLDRSIDVHITVIEGVAQLVSSMRLIHEEQADLLNRVCALLTSKVKNRTLGRSLNPPPSPGVRNRLHIACCYFFKAMVPLHALLSRQHQDDILYCMEQGLVGNYKQAVTICLQGLELASYEMPQSLQRILQRVLMRLSQLANSTDFAVSILHFINSFIRIDDLYRNFVKDDYKLVFTLCLQFMDLQIYGPYVVAVAYHLVSVWFVRCRVADRAEFVPFILSHASRVTTARQPSSGTPGPSEDSFGSLSDPAVVTPRTADKGAKASTHKQSLISQVSSTVAGAAGSSAARAATLIGVNRPPGVSPGPGAVANTQGPEIGRSPGGHRHTHSAATQHLMTAEAVTSAYQVMSDLLARYTHADVDALTRLPKGGESLMISPVSCSWILGTSLLTITTSRTGWSQITVRRPTGQVTWLMYLDNLLKPRPTRHLGHIPYADDRSGQSQGEFGKTMTRSTSPTTAGRRIDDSLGLGGSQLVGSIGDDAHGIAIPAGHRPSGGHQLQLEGSGGGKSSVHTLPSQGSFESFTRDFLAQRGHSGTLRVGSVPGDENDSEGGLQMAMVHHRLRQNSSGDPGIVTAGGGNERVTDEEIPLDPISGGTNAGSVNLDRIRIARMDSFNRGRGLFTEKSPLIATGDHAERDPLGGSGRSPGAHGTVSDLAARIARRVGRQSSIDERRLSSMRRSASHRTFASVLDVDAISTDKSTRFAQYRPQAAPTPSTTPAALSTSGMDDAPKSTSPGADGEDVQFSFDEEGGAAGNKSEQKVQTSSNDSLINGAGQQQVSVHQTTQSEPSQDMQRGADNGLGATGSENLLETTTKVAQTLERSPSPRIVTEHEEEYDVQSKMFLPAFLLLQLQHSTQMMQRPVPLHNNDALTRAMRILDSTSVYDTHKVAVVYVGPEQKSEVEILANSQGSSRYLHFLKYLGVFVRLRDAIDVYTGGLDRSNDEDGTYSVYSESDFTRIMYHVATLMPTTPNDPNCSNKKRHIGNDYVSIIFNESGSSYDTAWISGHFNFVDIEVNPLDFNLCAVTVHLRPGHEELMPTMGSAILSYPAAALYVRQTLILADMAASMRNGRNTLSGVPNWEERYRQLSTIRDRAASQGIDPRRLETANASTGHASTSGQRRPAPRGGVGRRRPGSVNEPPASGSANAVVSALALLPEDFTAFTVGT